MIDIMTRMFCVVDWSMGRCHSVL